MAREPTDEEIILLFHPWGSFFSEKYTHAPAEVSTQTPSGFDRIFEGLFDLG